MRVNDDFLEVDHALRNKAGNVVCGDSFMSHKSAGQGRLIGVLSDGLGSGIKASVLSTITASMLLNFSRMNEDIMDYASSVLQTLPRDALRKVAYSTFCLCDVDCFGNVRVVEYESPSFLLFRGPRSVNVPKARVAVEREDIADSALWISEFTIQKEDRIVFFSDGVSQSGMGAPSMPFGWNEGVAGFISELITENREISAKEIAERVVGRSVRNDGGALRDDTSCVVMYLRQPRNLLICTGPPYDEKDDAYLSRSVVEFPGKKIVCGGTTARIVSRETWRSIGIDLGFPRTGISRDLPPESKMEGIDLITEGILTLSKVERLLISGAGYSSSGPAEKIIRMLADSDKITFLVGTRINIAHQDPTLPVELEIRRNVVKKIAHYLEKRWLKDVDVRYL